MFHNQSFSFIKVGRKYVLNERERESLMITNDDAKCK